MDGSDGLQSRADEFLVALLLWSDFALVAALLDGLAKPRNQGRERGQEEWNGDGDGGQAGQDHVAEHLDVAGVVFEASFECCEVGGEIQELRKVVQKDAHALKSGLAVGDAVIHLAGVGAKHLLSDEREIGDGVLVDDVLHQLEMGLDERRPAMGGVGEGEDGEATGHDIGIVAHLPELDNVVLGQHFDGVGLEVFGQEGLEGADHDGADKRMLGGDAVQELLEAVGGREQGETPQTIRDQDAEAFILDVTILMDVLGKINQGRAARLGQFLGHCSQELAQGLEEEVALGFLGAEQLQECGQERRLASQADGAESRGRGVTAFVWGVVEEACEQSDDLLIGSKVVAATDFAETDQRDEDVADVGRFERFQEGSDRGLKLGRCGDLGDGGDGEGDHGQRLFALGFRREPLGHGEQGIVHLLESLKLTRDQGAEEIDQRLEGLALDEGRCDQFERAREQQAADLRGQGGGIGQMEAGKGKLQRIVTHLKVLDVDQAAGFSDELEDDGL